jgi:imidazolonepropionase-like amidohydrolase
VAGVLPAVRHAIERGSLRGPRLTFAGRILIPTGGHLHYLAGLVNQADGPDGFRRAVRQEAAAGADLIKVANNAADLTPAELAAAVDEAHRLGLKVACHTADPPSWRMALEAGVDTIEHGAPGEREIEQALAQGVTWVPTLHITAAFLEHCDRRRRCANPLLSRQAEAHYAATAELQERRQAAVAYALRAGLRLAAGTDAWLEGVPFASLAAELRQLVGCGATPLQALQAATSWPARAMGWARLGTLESGAAADIVAVEGDPLADIRALEHVVLVVLEGKVAAGRGEA